MSLTGKAALVTGASRGIGRTIALGLAEAGCSVACIASREENAADVVSEITAGGGKALAIGADVGSLAAAEEAVSRCIAEFGSLDVLVNNAGIARDQLILRMTEEEWDQVITTNLKGAWNFAKAAAKPMMKARWGRIINLSSIVGLSGQAGQTNYAAAKAGLIGLTMSLAKEFGSRGITCNAVAPGFIETDMTQGLPNEMREQILKSAPVGRLGTPEDVAAAVLFLAGEGASYITGQVLVVDGGLTL